MLTKGYAKHTTVLSGQAETIEVIGGISLQGTGLNEDSLRDDTMNRLVIFESDDTEEKTKRVIESIVGRYGKMSQFIRDDYSDYINFFKSLKSYPVVIPYSDEIKFENKMFEARRGAKIFMDLLSAVALLNQRKRKIERGVLVSEREDFEILLEISKIENQKKEINLNYSQKVILEAIKRVPDPNQFTYQDVEKARPIAQGDKSYELSSIKKAISKLREIGVVELVKDSRPCLFGLSNNSSENRFGVASPKVLE